MAGSYGNEDSRDSFERMAGVSHGTLDKAGKIIREADEGTMDMIYRGKSRKTSLADPDKMIASESGQPGPGI